jgi:hypothetical protein
MRIATKYTGGTIVASKASTKQLDNFFRAATSLKLFSRAELNDDHNRSLIEKLYVDPLPNEQAFKTLLGNNTTILVGRKGTGKSTVFQRAQREIRKSKLGIISAYMDIRNVFESSQVDEMPTDQSEQLASAMSADQLKRFLLYKRFFSSLIADIRTELKAQVQQNFLSRLKERVRGTAAEVFAGLDQIIKKMETPQYEVINAFVALDKKVTAKEKDTFKGTAGGEFTVNPDKIGISVRAGVEASAEQAGIQEDSYVQLLMRVVGVNDVISELRNILSAIDVKHLHIFLDDFSELPEEAMRVLVDSLIAPLTRWSEFIKFKIAAYPGRVYLGSLDKTKIEEFHLDTFGLYGSSGVMKMEDKATDFVQRVIEKRILHFCKISPNAYFVDRHGDLWRTLFYASMANPRILGHLMLYAYESHLLYGNKIGIQAIQEAAQRYYEEKVSAFLHQVNTGLRFTKGRVYFP